MKRPLQKDINPYPNTNSNKRYQTFDYYLKKRFGEKCAKISLDAGFTCPNIDGTKGVGGCIYCSNGASGAQCKGTVEEQYIKGVETVKRKWDCNKFIPYLQAHTNTYSNIKELQDLYERAAVLPNAVMLAIATRADCLSEPVVQLLKEISKKIPLIVELGLQSSNDKTAEIINRCHTFNEFCEGYSRLKNAGGDICICIHIINGLPGEDFDCMIKTARDVAKLNPDMVKIHLLHVVKNTKLCQMFENGLYAPMTEEEYVNTVVSQIELMPENAVIARVTGDGVRDSLVSPMWSTRKTAVTNEIDKKLFAKGTYQGKNYSKNL